MFLMKFSSNQQNVTSKPMFALDEDFVDFHVRKTTEIGIKDFVDFHARETTEIGIKDSAILPTQDQVASIHDEKEFPEWYSPSLGPVDEAEPPSSYFGGLYKETSTQEAITVDEAKPPSSDFGGLYKETSTKEAITVDKAKPPSSNLGWLYGKKTSTKEAIAIAIAKSKKSLEDKIKSERAATDLYLIPQQTEFFTSMQTILSGKNEAIEVKKQAIFAALNIYFKNAYTSLQHAKSNMQEKILKTHADTLGNKPLTTFEYSIMCCLSKLDFVFDKSITNLSSKQDAYMQALANDAVSGEDQDLFHEIPNYVEQYTAIIQTIEEQLIELISIHDENNYNELPLAAKLRETIQQFKALNVDEKINKPIYTVAEIAMQAYCTSLVKNAKIRKYFISDAGFNLNCDQGMNLLNSWICSPEFIDPQSKLRQGIWEILFTELIDDFEIILYAKQSLHKAAKDWVLQNNLPCFMPAYTASQAHSASTYSIIGGSPCKHKANRNKNDNAL